MECTEVPEMISMQNYDSNTSHKVSLKCILFGSCFCVYYGATKSIGFTVVVNLNPFLFTPPIQRKQTHIKMIKNFLYPLLIHFMMELQVS